MKYLISLIFACGFAFIAEAARIELLITPPNQDGGADLVYYHIEISADRGERWQRLKPVAAIKVDLGGGIFEYAEIPVRLPELQKNTIYWVRVAASNIYRMGEFGDYLELDTSNEYEYPQRIKCGNVPGYLLRVIENKKNSVEVGRNIWCRREEL